MKNKLAFFIIFLFLVLPFCSSVFAAEKIIPPAAVIIDAGIPNLNYMSMAGKDEGNSKINYNTNNDNSITPDLNAMSMAQNLNEGSNPEDYTTLSAKNQLTKSEPTNCPQCGSDHIEDMWVKGHFRGYYCYNCNHLFR